MKIEIPITLALTLLTAAASAQSLPTPPCNNPNSWSRDSAGCIRDDMPAQPDAVPLATPQGTTPTPVPPPAPVRSRPVPLNPMPANPVPPATPPANVTPTSPPPTTPVPGATQQ